MYQVDLYQGGSGRGSGILGHAPFRYGTGCPRGVPRPAIKHNNHGRHPLVKGERDGYRESFSTPFRTVYQEQDITQEFAVRRLGRVKVSTWTNAPEVHHRHADYDVQTYGDDYKRDYKANDSDLDRLEEEARAKRGAWTAEH
jgi:hypothetical protein